MAVHVNPDPESTARLEQRALEKMASALCEHSQRLLAGARSRGVLKSREANFQVQAFAERQEQVGRLLQAPASGPDESRMARLEQLVSALECSRGYFRNLQ
ncbi:MAG: hypothetical protein ABW278_05930 [Steroidobacteraceae bacterium]